MKPEKTGRRCVLILLILLAAVFFLSFLLGRYRVSALQTARLLADRALSGVSRGHLRLAPTWTPEEASVVIQIRLPRILSAALIGAALSAAGASYQAMFRNPMVSPDLLGASTGACFGAALAILLGASYAVITAGSFLFGLAAVGLTYLVGRLSRMRSNLAMVLAGVMVGSLFSAGTSFIKLVADTNEQLPAITYWLMGALTAVRLDDLHFAMVPILLGLIPLFFLRWRLNLLTISEAEARSMGVNTKLLRLAVIVCATLATAASVSISGMIGWVGLVIPHICRLLVGQNTRLLLGKSVEEQRPDTFEQLSRAAKAIGVTIARSGSFPEEGTENAQLVEAAAHECLTNLVRHAGGTRLEIFGEKTASAWKVRYLNDGAVPAAPIVEGSGLTALRTRTEAAGGAMEIAVLPRFQLTLILQRERQAME